MGRAALATSTLTLADLSGPERSAALLMFVHPRVAAGLLSRLSAGEVTQIGIATRRLERLSPELIESVVAEFVRDLSDVVHLPHSGKDFALEKLSNLVREEDRDAVQADMEREVGQEFAQFISGCLPSAVAIMLKDEHPQARATALLLMGSENASKVLSLMLDREQYECTRRMARIQSIDAKTARDVEHSLRESLGSGMIDRFRFQGVDQTARVLCRMGKKAYEPLLKKIASRDPALADAIQKRMVRFEDLQVLDRRGIQALLKEVDSAELVVALRGADQAVLDRFLANLSKRRAQDLVEEISLSGALPMRKVTEARESLVQTAMRLHEEGALFFPVGGEAEEMI